ncbi:histidine phosphatase family protein [Mycobacterium sp. NPDC050441]|uniref:histidine phosphatase family protein n=1 Tax=Mycobacterium sp. NPDC050441 TaxID=3155403 RepID=UPI0033F2B67B
MQRPNRRRAAGAAATTLTACSLFAAATLPAAAMTVTFIRHAESQGNASGYIDTSTPGPHLTNDQVNQNGGATGEQQALDWANAQCPTAECTKYDALYASTMIRTQETAAPFAAKRGLPVTVLGAFDPDHPQQNSGVQEISAGIFEGLPESEGIGRIGYILAPLAWTMGLQFVPIPGGENGLEFNERVTNALTQVEDDTTDTNGDGEVDAAVFSHGATIMMWTMMNVDNPNLLLIVQHPLNNTDTVVVEKNDDGSWTLKEWAGQEVGPANYPTQMFVNVRDLIVAPQKAIYNMRIPVLSLDAQGIVTTGAQGLQDVAQAGVKFVTDSVTDTVNAITGIPGSLGQSTTQVSKLSTQKAVTERSAPTVADLAEDAKSAVENATEDTKAVVEKVSEGATSAVEKTTESVEKTTAVRTTNGATKLSDGNKAEPGKAVSAVRDRANRAADDVRSGIESSAKQARETVKKLTGADKAEKSDKSDNNTAKPKAKDAA